MVDNPAVDIADRLALSTESQVKALAHPMRTTILQLLLERPASITELATAVDRPKSTVAHHVDVLTRNGLLQVAYTRRVRAIEERFYARTARMFFVAGTAAGDVEDRPRDFNDFEVAAAESAPAFEDGRLWGFIRHSRLSEERVAEFWERMAALVEEFDALPREGETVYGFAVGIYPTDHPRLPDQG